MNNITITSPKLKNRNGIIYIDCNTKPFGRLRFSTSLPFSKENCDSIALRIKELVYEFLQVDTKSTNERIYIQDIAHDFLNERCAHLKNQSILKYKTHINDFCKVFKKDIRLITQAEFSAYASKNIKSRIDFFNRLIAYAKDCNIQLALRPIMLRGSQSIEPDVAPFTLEEVKLLLSKAQGDFKAFLSVAFFSGMRTGELLALEFEDIDFLNDKIKVNKSLEQSGKLTTTKTHKGRYIDMLPIAKQALELMWEQSKKCVEICAKSKNGRVFTLSRNQLQNRWKELLEVCGFAYRVLYQTRHSFATIMLVHNEEPLWISSMLGHKSLATTYEHYIKYIPEKKKRASFVDFDFQGVSDDSDI